MSTALKDLTSEIVATFDNAQLKGGLEIRRDALGHFGKLGFPDNKHEEYRFTPVAKNLEKIFTSSKGVTAGAIKDVNDYQIPDLDANCLVFVNGEFSTTLSKIISPASELTVKPLAQALDENSAVANEYFGKLISSSSDGFAAYNTAFWRGGIFIHVPKDTIVKTPILILHLHDSTSQAVVSTNRILMVIEEQSEVFLIERFDSIGNQPTFSSWVEEIVVKKNAKLNYCKIQNDPGFVHQVASTLIKQSASSHVNTFTLTMNGKIIRNNFGILIDGERCESHFYGLYLLAGETHADNHTVVDHRQPNAFSNQLYKGILDDRAKGIFNGKIYVRPHAQKTNAFQSNRNVLLTDSAVIHTKPQLEIWADDVKCSHGCTSGQLDDEALFYLQSRGISKSNAQALLLYAFADEVLAPIGNEALKNYLKKIISERLHQEF